MLAALSPNAYSTANLTIGGALSVDTGSSTYFSGTLAAASINNTGGTIRGNGTLDATGSASIGNTGTIEAVADFTLGSQRLVVADSLTGTGKLLIDAGATMVLSGQVQDQTITFADNTARQFASTVYSPSTLVLGQPGQLTGTTSIEGFTFADRLVLENVTLSDDGRHTGGVRLGHQYPDGHPGRRCDAELLAHRQPSVSPDCRRRAPRRGLRSSSASSPHRQE